MLRSRRFSTGQAGRLACLGAAATLILGSSLSAGESATKNTVFKGDQGSDWVVSIRPAKKTAQADAREVPVPPPVDLVLPAGATVAQNVPTPAEPTPAEAAPSLPPVPEIKAAPAPPATAHGVTVVPAGPPPLQVMGRMYQDAYRSIPFNRAEYDANPSYRHEAAMELLFGQMRPTTIVKQMPAPKTDEPDYSPYKPFIPAYGDYSSYRALPLPYPLFDQWNLPNSMWPSF